MDVKQLLIDCVSGFGFPVFLQGSIADDEAYPDSFFTYWNNETESLNYYDNEETQIIWDFDLNFYTNAPETIDSTIAQAKQQLKAAGFIVGGAGYDVLSDEPSHTGRGINPIYIERMILND